VYQAALLDPNTAATLTTAQTVAMCDEPVRGAPGPAARRVRGLTDPGIVPGLGTQEGMRLALTHRTGRRLALVAAAAASVMLGPLAGRDPGVGARTAPRASAPIPAPGHHGALRISGGPRDGAVVTASGLAWQVPRLPRGMRLLSFEVAYTWQSCARDGRECRTAADPTRDPVRRPPVPAGHADTGRRLRVTETAVRGGSRRGRGDFTFRVIRRSVSRLAAVPVRAYRRHQRPVSYFRNGTPQGRTASTSEWFQVGAPDYNTADGTAAQRYQVDGGRWRPMPASGAFYTGNAPDRPAPGAWCAPLKPGRGRPGSGSRGGSRRCRPRWPATRRTAGRAGTRPTFASGTGRRPPADALGLAESGRTTPLQADREARRGHLRHRRVPHPRRGGPRDHDPLGRRARSRTRKPSATWTWPGRTTRPDASPSPRGPFPAAALGNVYTATPRNAGSISANWTASSRCCASGSHVRPQGVRRGGTGRHRQLRPAVGDRVPAHPRRRAEPPGLRVQPWSTPAG